MRNIVKKAALVVGVFTLGYYYNDRVYLVACAKAGWNDPSSAKHPLQTSAAIYKATHK